MKKFMFMRNVFFFFILTFNILSFANLKIMTTTPNLKSLVENLSLDSTKVSSIALGTQDPHFIEAKPSYAVKLRSTDLLVNIGLDLENAWLPLIISKSKNQKLRKNGSSRLELGDFIQPLDHGHSHSRAHGDVHPNGNPHFMLSPKVVLQLSNKVTSKLIEMDPSNKEIYNQKNKTFKAKLEKLFQESKAKIQPDLKVVSYHKTLTYFYKDFGVNNIEVLEPKPGVPPTAKHIMNVIKKMKSQNVKKIIIENYFDPSVSKKIIEQVKGSKVHIVPVSVDGNKKVKDIFQLYQALVTALE